MGEMERMDRTEREFGDKWTVLRNAFNLEQKREKGWGGGGGGVES